MPALFCSFCVFSFCFFCQMPHTANIQQTRIAGHRQVTQPLWIHWFYTTGATTHCSHPQLPPPPPPGRPRSTDPEGASWPQESTSATASQVSISETADLQGFSHQTISMISREWPEKEKISSERQEIKATIHTGSPKLYNRRLEKWCQIWWVSISADLYIQMVGSELGINMKAWIHPALYQW